MNGLVFSSGEAGEVEQSEYPAGQMMLRGFS